MNTTIIHPMIVHFPVALLLTAFFFATIAIISKNKYPKIFDFNTIAATIIISLGIISAIAAICSGYLFTNEMTGIMGITRNNHIIFAFCTLAVSLVAGVLNGFYILKQKANNNLLYGSYIFYIATAILIGITGHLGGSMVFGF